MSTKLSTIATQYSRFIDNQVLTKDQLNEFLDYFDDQDRLSRIALSGVGIVCGLDFELNINTNVITVNQGYGVTTDGDLLMLQNRLPENSEETTDVLKQKRLQRKINFDKKVFTHFKVFDNGKANYPAFDTGEGSPIQILELADKNDYDGYQITIEDDGFSEISEAGDLKNYVVFIYLECYAEEGDLCKGLSCDDQGIPQIANTKLLLVPTSLAETIAAQDKVFKKHQLQEFHIDLPEVFVKRVVLDTANTATFDNLKTAYHGAINANDTIANLSDGIDKILEKFGKVSLKAKIEQLFNFSDTAVLPDFQYRYDLLKDLADTYNEMKALLQCINVECCPGIGSFPKHLMLGKIDETKDFETLRHKFYKSPIIGHEDDNLKKLQLLFERVESIVISYKTANKGDEIRVTPSKALSVLGDKAVPFYYDAKDNFLKNWNYEKTKNFKESNNLGYHFQKEGVDNHIANPLAYDHMDKDFFRIEGVQGKLYNEALEKLKAIKRKYGLNFDIKLLSIDASLQNIELEDYRCEFEDLQVLLEAWTTEQNCTLEEITDFFSGFSLEEVGRNDKKQDYLSGIVRVKKIKGQTDGPIRFKTKETGIARVAFDKMAISDTKTENLGIRSGEPSAKQYYQESKKNVVLDNLDKKEGTLGLLLKETIEDNKDDNAIELYKKAKDRINESVDETVWDENPKAKDLILDGIVKVLVDSYGLVERAPTRLNQVISGSIKLYTETQKSLCATVKRLKATYQTAEIDDTLKDILGLLINQLSTVCCSGKKLEILLVQIEERKQRILDKIKLQNFVEDNNALEHKAGAGPGETFVMVYITDVDSDIENFRPVSLTIPFKEQPTPKTASVSGDIATIQLWDRSVNTEFGFTKEPVRNNLVLGKTKRFQPLVPIGATIDETVQNMADYLNFHWRIARASNFIEAKMIRGRGLRITIKDRSVPKNAYYFSLNDNQKNGFGFDFVRPIKRKNRLYFPENEVIETNVVEKNTVIADFTLPYICCSDCEPINFIIPEPPVFLSIPETVCLDGEPVPIPFTISPEDGTVEALPSAAQAAIVIDADGKPQFDPSLLDENLYGERITFTVNGKETSANITVFRISDVQVAIDDINYNEDKTTAQVIFQLSSDHLEDITTYTWDLGDGRTLQNAPDTNDQVVFEYDLPIGETNEVFPSLEVSNGFCTHTIEVPAIPFEEQDVSFEIVDELCIDPSGENSIETIEFTVTPANKTVTLADPTINGIDIEDSTVVITKSDFGHYNQPIEFEVDGEMVEATLTLRERPVNATIIADPVAATALPGQEVSFSFSVGGLRNPSDNISYAWNFNSGEATAEIAEPEFNFTVPDGADGFVTFEVVLTVDEGICAPVRVVTEIRIDITEITFEISESEICFDEQTEVAYTISPVSLVPTTETTGITVIGAGIATPVIRFEESFSNFNQAIAFEVEGVIRTITVRKKPEDIGITFDEPGNVFPGGTTNLQFNITGINEDEVSNYEYQWFVDDVLVVGATTHDPRLALTTDLDDSDSRTFQVRASVLGSPCEAVAIPAVPVTISITPFSFTIDQSEICLGEVNSIGYTVVPNTLLPSTTTPGIVFNRTNPSAPTIVFSTGFNTFDQPINITAGGITRSITARRLPPGADFDPPANTTVNAGTNITRTFSVTGVASGVDDHYNFRWVRTNPDGSQAIRNGLSVTIPFSIPAGAAGIIRFPVRLEISGTPCESPRTIEKLVTFNIQVIEEPATCEELRFDQIKVDRENLVREDDITVFLANEVTLPTRQRYDDVIGLETEFMTGNLNDNLPEFLAVLFEQTSMILLQQEPSSGEYAIAAKYFEAQIRLLINILHCQSDDILIEQLSDGGVLFDFLEALKSHLKDLQARAQVSGVNYDPDRSIQAFLAACIEAGLPSPSLENLINEIIALLP
ncbi:hypothetical protein ACFQ1M_05740 [Sungkyunkwania multivorans]|uniref:PKD domain-containing protein n=1 Tax=Sungkyunkwania multivorans TaxID=1173618 RepID=A0ABW3CWL4_9FLAO